MTEDDVGVVAALWRLFQERRWSEARDLLANDFEAWWPHTRERIGSADAFIALNRDYPEPWSITVRHLHRSSTAVVAEVAVTHPGGISYCASFATVSAGQIARLIEYWADDDHEPPQWRAHLVERFDCLLTSTSQAGGGIGR